MPKKKKKSKKRPVKKLSVAERCQDAKHWLISPSFRKESQKPLLESYAERYGICESQAWHELAALGYYDTLMIENYEQQGIEWEYRIEPLTGAMLPVPTDIEECEIYEWHPII